MLFTNYIIIMVKRNIEDIKTIVKNKEQKN